MKSTCRIDRCDSFVTGLGLCNAHYRMMRKHGDPLVKKGITPGTVRSWLERHVSYTSDECLVFPFGKAPTGYGIISLDGFRRAHRWMCCNVNGPAPEGKTFALHSCGQGGAGCVNPRHLYWGDAKDNYADQVAHGVAAIGERHPKAVLTTDIVGEIRRIHSRGDLGYKRLAKRYSVNEKTIRAVVNGVTWKQVTL